MVGDLFPVAIKPHKEITSKRRKIMIKFIVAAATVMFFTSSAIAKETNYSKIVAEWSSQVIKQRHQIINILDENNKKNSKKQSFNILEGWKAEIIKINTRRNKPTHIFCPRNGC